MVEYILGNYLVEEGRITRKQLGEVIDKMDEVRIKLGLIAVAEGMMTNEQADEVNRLQTVMDKRFGDIAVEKGYLTNEQIGNLLKAQGNTFLAFVQVLVDSGYIGMDGIDEVMEGFRNSNSFGKSEIEWLKSDDVDKIIPLYLSPETLEFSEIIGVAVRTIIRFIDRHVYVGKVSYAGDVKLCNAAIQAVDGEDGTTAAFSEVSGGLLLLTNIFGQEDFSALNEDSLDAAGEFLNCINGLHASALSQKGAVLELMPPELVVEEKLVSASKVCIMPIFIKDKELKFIVMK